SDERFHNLGAMPRLFWQVIKEAKAEQLEELDLGRSDASNAGLARFKDHLGATRTSMTYWHFPRKAPVKAAWLGGASMSFLFQNLLLRLPDRLFRLAGEILYRHAG